MQPPGTVGGAAKPGQLPPEGALLLPEALQQLYRAIHKSTIYPEGHPEVAGTIARAADMLGESLAGRPSVVIGVSKDHLLLDDGPIEPPQVPLTALARLLHEIDVVALEIRAQVNAAELKSFIACVVTARRARDEGPSLREVLKGSEHPNIRVSMLDYRGLTFREWVESDGTKDPRDEGTVWDDLVRTLTDPATYRTGSAAPADLARLVNRQAARRRSTGTAPLRQRMHAMTRRLQAMSEEQRTGLRARLAGFVSGLSEDLRRDLLRVDPGDPGDGVALMTELAPALPDPILLDVLKGIDAHGEKVPSHFLTFLNKVSRISSEQSPVGVGLQDVLGRWGVSQEVLASDATTMRSALEEVFRQRAEANFNPDAYQQLLEDLATRELPRQCRALFTRYRDPRDPVEVQAHVAEIAVRLLEEEEVGSQDRAGLIGYLGAATDQLLEGGHYHSVRDAAVAAKRICYGRQEAEETRLAAEGFLHDLTAEERIDLLLNRACRGESVPRAVAALLALGGVLALGRILDFLDKGPAPQVASVLESLAVRMGFDPMEEVLRARWSDGWASLRPTIRVIRLLPGRDAVRLLDQLLSHPDTRVRREALAALCLVDRRPGAPERYLRQALGNDDPRLVAFAIQQLFTRGRPESIEVLGAYVEGSIERADPGLAFLRRAAQGMAALGAPGRARLCQCLDLLRSKLRPRAVRNGRLIQEILHPHREEPQVRAALGRWRYSLAGVLSLAAARSRVSSEEPRE